MRTLYLTMIFFLGCQGIQGDVLDESGYIIGSYDCYDSSTFNGSEVHFNIEDLDKDHILLTRESNFPLMIPFHRFDGEINMIYFSEKCDDLDGGIISTI
jgi:hypothetical protein